MMLIGPTVILMNLHQNILDLLSSSQFPLFPCPSLHPGLHELDAINDQEVKDFRSKMCRISEDRMQRVQMMTCTQWLQACFSPQLEPSAGSAAGDGLGERLADLKVIIHFDQSQVSKSLLQGS